MDGGMAKMRAMQGMNSFLQLIIKARAFLGAHLSLYLVAGISHIRLPASPRLQRPRVPATQQKTASDRLHEKLGLDGMGKK